MENIGFGKFFVLVSLVRSQTIHSKLEIGKLPTNERSCTCSNRTLNNIDHLFSFRRAFILFACLGGWIFRFSIFADTLIELRRFYFQLNDSGRVSMVLTLERNRRVCVLFVFYFMVTTVLKTL